MQIPNAVQSVIDKNDGEVMIPESDEVVPPKYPGGRDANADEGGSRRLQLSIWMASRDNPYLPRAAVNRAWNHMFGRGLVEPIDDMSFQNEPSHPVLLNELADYFARTGFDLKNLYRTLASTKAYQLASRVTPAEDNPGEDNPGDATKVSATKDGETENSVTNDGIRPDETASEDLLSSTRLFAHMNVKTLGADQVYDSLERFLAASSGQEIFPGMMVDQRRLQFVTQMRMQTRNLRDFERGAAQALMLMNGNEAQELTSKGKRQFTAALMSPILSDTDRIDALFLASVSRFPTSTESSAVRAMLEQESDQQKVFGDVLWAIVNSAEFSLNH